MQSVERRGILELRPLAAALHDLELRAGDQAGNAPPLGDVGGWIVRRPEHEGGRFDPAVIGGEHQVASTDVHVLQREQVAHVVRHAWPSVDRLAGGDQIICHL